MFLALLALSLKPLYIYIQAELHDHKAYISSVFNLFSRSRETHLKSSLLFRKLCNLRFFSIIS